MMIEPLGISTYLFCSEKLCKEHLATVSKAGIRFIEIWGCSPHFDCRDLAGISDIRKMAGEYGLQIHSLHTTSGLPDDMDNVTIFSFDDEVRKAAVAEVNKQIDATAMLGGQIVVLHPGGNVEDSERDRRKQKSIESAKEILDHCVCKGVKLAIENTLDRAICREADELRDYVDSFRSDDVGICFDTSHANLTQDIFAAQRTCGQKIITLHMSDNRGEKDDHLIPYQGEIDWSEFMDVLHDVGYKGVFTFEIKGTHNNAETARCTTEAFHRLYNDQS